MRNHNFQFIYYLLIVLTLANCAPIPSAYPTTIFTSSPSSTSALSTDTPTSIPTSIFSTLPIISTTNAASIKEITKLSKGTINQTIWFSDNRRIAVSTTVGIYIYDITTNKELNYFETSASPHIAVSSDGKLLAAGAGTSVWLWEIETGLEMHRLEITEKRVESVAFSPNGKILVAEIIVQFSDGEGLPETDAVVVWDTSTGETLFTLMRRSWPVFNSSGNTLATYFGHKVELWDSNTGHLIHSIDGEEGFQISSDDRLIATRGPNFTTFHSTIETSIVQTEKSICQTDSTSSFSDLEFSSDTLKLAIGMVNDVQVWDVENCQMLYSLPGHSGYVDVAFSPNGKVLASYGRVDRNLKLWNAQNGKPIRTLTGFWGDLGDFSPDGQFLIEKRWYKGTIAIWDVNTRQVIFSLDKHTPHAGSLAFSPDGQTLASGHSYGGMILWSVETGEIQQTIQGAGYVFDIAFSLDGQKLVSGETTVIGNNEEAKLEIWDVASEKSLFAWQSDNKDKTWLTDIEISPDGAYVAGRSSDQTIRLWDANTYEIKYIYVLTDGSTYTHDDGMAISPNGQIFAMITSDKFMKFWNINNGNLLFSLYTPSDYDEPTKIYFSPNGHKLIAAGYRTVWIYDIETRKLEATIEDAGNNISDIAINPDGTLLALSGWTGKDNLYEIKVFDLNTKYPLVSISGHTDWITKLAFSPDGRFIGSSSADGTVRLWGIKP